MFHKESIAKRVFKKPEVKIIIFDREDILTTSVQGNPVNYNKDNLEKWDTPKISGSNNE